MHVTRKRREVAIVYYLLCTRYGMADARQRAKHLLLKMHVRQADWCTCVLSKWGKEYNNKKITQWNTLRKGVRTWKAIT
jgi:hypothetical protein